MLESFGSTLVFMFVGLLACAAFSGSILGLFVLFGGTAVSFGLALVAVVGICLLGLEVAKRVMY